VSGFHATQKIDTVKSGAIVGMSTKILIVDDDAELREALVDQFALHEEFESIGVETGGEGVQAAKAGEIDLVIMDVGLPDLDGREAVRILRKVGFKAPIIMLSGHDGDADTILALESGANDYVVKPFRFAVLLARFAHNCASTRRATMRCLISAPIHSARAPSSCSIPRAPRFASPKRRPRS
jgi:DNA-binding response OmpR family regulator